MNFVQSAYNLLFDQKAFFSQKRDGLKNPLLITLIYAVVSCIAALPTLYDAGLLMPDGLGVIVIVTGIISGFFSIVLSWVVVSAIFFGCLKFIGYAECDFKQVLAICGYVSGILLISSVFTGLISVIGVANAAALLILSGVFLLWSVPVWYYGFKTICDIPEKKLKNVVAVPVILMTLVAVVSNIGVLFA